MELILDKNKKKEHLYLEVFHYYRELIMEKKLPPGQDALPSKMFTGAEAEPHHH